MTWEQWRGGKSRLWVRGGAGSEAWGLGTPGVTPVSSPREQGEGGAAAGQVTGRKRSKDLGEARSWHLNILSGVLAGSLM